MSTRLRAVLFDLDGTLLDTRDDLVASINALRQQLELPPLPRETAIAAVGRGVSNLVENSLADAASPDLADAVARFRAHYLAHCTDAVQAYPGMAQLLADLEIAGVKRAVVTNKPQDSAARLIAHCDLAVDLVIGADPGLPLKPDPAMLHAALGALDVPRHRSVYLGDMETDLQCARAADCPFVGVAFGFAPGPDLMGRAAVCVDNVEALRSALLS